MERSGRTVPAVTDSQLVTVAGWEGPFLSVYMNTEQQEPNAAQLAELRWSSLRRKLEREGTDASCLDAVGGLVADAHLEGAAFGAVVTPAGERFVDYYRAGLSSDIARFAPAPTLTPALSWRQEEPSHLVVLADRAGADITAVTRSKPPSDLTVEVEQWPLSKSRGGGWAHWGMQRVVEETWARNARAVAAEVERLADALEARLVVLAGDPEAIGLLRKELPRHLAEAIHETPGSRAAEAGAEALGERTARLVRSATAEDTVEAIELFRQELGQADRAVEGPAAALAALRRSQVDVLLVHDDGGEGEGACFALDEPELCALEPGDLDGLGHPDISRARLVDVAVRAALRTGASCRVVPGHGGPAGGIGAILRWSEAAGAA